MQRYNYYEALYDSGLKKLRMFVKKSSFIVSQVMHRIFLLLLADFTLRLTTGVQTASMIPFLYK